MVQTQQIAKIFKDPKRGDVHAVDGVSIEAKPGQILGLLGANGAGKTTLLRMLSTVITPSAGSGSVAGFDIVNEPEKVRQNIGFLSASTALYGRLTPREVLNYFAELYGLEPNQKAHRIEHAIEAMRLHEFADSLCDKLSTGQKQRTSIARTILHDPPVLFFDEPTSGLDVIMAQEVMKFVEHMREINKTVVYCTHIMSEVERLCDHVSVIHQGRICASGNVSELKSLTNQPTLEKAFLSLVEAGEAA